MNKSIHWTNEGTRTHSDPIPSNLVKRLRHRPDTTILPQDVVPESNLNPNIQRKMARAELGSRVWSSQNNVKFVSGRVRRRQHSDNGRGQTSITKGLHGVNNRFPIPAGLCFLQRNKIQQAAGYLKPPPPNQDIEYSYVG
jgi:hypothetical protein